MDERRIEDALHAGPPDERAHQQGALARALAERDQEQAGAIAFSVGARQRPSMSLAGIAAVVLVVALIAAGAWSGRHESSGASGAPGGDVGPTGGTALAPSPAVSAQATAALSPSPAASSAIGGAPLALVDRWLGPTGGSGGTGQPARRAVLDIRGVELRYGTDGHSPDGFMSSVAASGSEELTLTSLGATSGCRTYDEGRYRWELSPAGSSLTLAVIADDCGARAAALAGRWTHTACRDAAQDCLGPIEAGTYDSTALDLTGTGAAGQLRYTVPDGWANTIDFPTNYFLRPAADYRADPAFDGNDIVSGIYVWAGTLAAAQPADCSGVAANGVEASADAIARHFATLPGLVVGDRGTTSLDGRSARVLDLSLDPGYAGTCPWASGRPFRSLITMADGGQDRGVWGLGAGARQRVFLLDVAPGRVVSIWIESQADRFDAMAEQAAPIVSTFHFDSGATGQ
ncbi:MAG TPA: hypothetical protein VGK16_13755 [Candidatus Limnocylindrales bacterium]|jgi:hypothetical protein